jgi:tetratricopeptide (TPR) repeat protein
MLAMWLLALSIGGLLLSTLGAGSPVTALPRPTPTDTAVPDTPTPTVLQRLQTLHDPLWAAWEAGDWPECLRILEQMRSLQKDYAGLNDWFVAVHSAWGTELVEADELEEAIRHFDLVRELDPGHEMAQKQRLLARSYLDAQASMAAAQWEAAISHLRAALDLDPSYRDAEELLYRAYLRRGTQQQEAGELQAAKKSYEQALAVQDGAEAQDALAEVVFLLTPPTPTPTPKRIEVYIGQQRMYVYEGDRLIWNWVVSTGEPGRNTRTGHFQVLDKIPNAYASRWDLQMPHWLGIYYAGASENGIHALPILSNGQRLWAGFLGQRVSYGCVILGVEEARLLYGWAEVGTPVDIYP